MGRSWRWSGPWEGAAAGRLRPPIRVGRPLNAVNDSFLALDARNESFTASKAPQRGAAWAQARAHRWFACPLQLHRIAWVPLAAPAPSASRQSPDWTFRTDPSAPNVHFWLACPLHGQLITRVPFVVPWWSASRHLSPNTRTSPVSHVVHSWFAAVWQSQISVPAPAAVEALSTSRQRPEPAPRSREVVAASGAPPDTRYAATPCAGTLAELAPPVVEVAPVHTSVRVNDVPESPLCAAVVLTVVVALPRLSSPTATDPSARGLAKTSTLPSSRTRRPPAPRRSWSLASRRGFRSTALMSADIVRMSLPAISGAAIRAHNAKWARDSVSDNPGRPTTSMSGSFQWPGPACAASGAVTSRTLPTPIG